jgi:tRNA U55 pseudouridine synthase TruB
MISGHLSMSTNRTESGASYQAMTKVYSGTMRLGEYTPSYDADTEVSRSVL